MKLKTIYLVIVSIIILSCSSTKNTTKAKSTSISETETVNKRAKLLNNYTFILTEKSKDKTYGYEENNPVKVGGVKSSEGPLNERRFLNALAGPNGEKVTYHRAGSCCHFKTKNGMINGTGLLDKYRVTWEGSKDTVSIYINMYDFGKLKAPVGFEIKK